METPTSDIQGTCMRQRWRKNTLREVYFRDDGKVTKRYWIRPGARRYPKPWVREHEALLRLDGDGFPRTHGLQERPFDRGREFLLIRDFVEGKVMAHVSVSDAQQIGGLMARMHRAGVIMDDAALDNFVKDDNGRIQCIDFGCAKLFSTCKPCLAYAAGEELSKLRRKTFHENEECWEAFKKSYFLARNAHPLMKWVTWLGYGISRGTRLVRKDLLGAKARMRRYEERYGVPQCREKRFEKGAMIVHPELDCRGQLEAYISSLQFLDLPEAERISTHNKRYRVYSFHLPAAGREVILKVSWANPAYSWGRRLNIRVLQWVKDYAKVAFLGALALDRIGIRTIKPLACWRYARTPFDVESYLLYEKRPALSSALELKREVEADPTEERHAVLNAVIDRMADIVRRMHEHSVRHDDIAIGNFLVVIGDPTAPDSDPVRRYSVAMIDTDHITLSRLRRGRLKRVFDLRDLRRLNLDEPGRRRFLQRYMGDDFGEGWWKVHMFWRRWGKRPGRLLVQIMTGRGSLRED